jgi:hypothetical protein
MTPSWFMIAENPDKPPPRFAESIGPSFFDVKLKPGLV